MDKIKKSSSLKGYTTVDNISFFVSGTFLFADIFLAIFTDFFVIWERVFGIYRSSNIILFLAFGKINGRQNFFSKTKTSHNCTIYTGHFIGIISIFAII